MVTRSRTPHVAIRSGSPASPPHPLVLGTLELRPRPAHRGLSVRFNSWTARRPTAWLRPPGAPALQPPATSLDSGTKRGAAAEETRRLRAGSVLRTALLWAGAGTGRAERAGLNPGKHQAPQSAGGRCSVCVEEEERGCQEAGRPTGRLCVPCSHTLGLQAPRRARQRWALGTMGAMGPRLGLRPCEPERGRSSLCVMGGKPGPSR